MKIIFRDSQKLKTLFSTSELHFVLLKILYSVTFWKY